MNNRSLSRTVHILTLCLLIVVLNVIWGQVCARVFINQPMIGLGLSLIGGLILGIIGFRWAFGQESLK